MKILITGSTNGMGKGATKVLAAADNKTHEVIALNRSKELSEALIIELENITSNKNISFILCDLAKISDVRNAVNEIKSKHKFIDCIFINAGLGYASQRVETEDGMDSHFQVNYLSQFMLTLNLLDLLENSENGGRIIFNVTKGGKIFWDDMQIRKKWSYIAGICQAMAAKRMFLVKLHNIYININGSRLSFIGFQIPKTVWTNQVNIIPFYMRIMASAMKLFGAFISIEKCGEIMAPLFTETHLESLNKSGKLITWKKNKFADLIEDADILNKEAQDKLWEISLELCSDEKTAQISKKLNSKALAQAGGMP